MTGGQPVEQQITPIDMVNQLLSEGVRPVHLISDHPEQYAGQTLPANTRVHHRDDLDRVQRELQKTKGVTGIVYEQTCAAEKRRRRKRKLMDDPPQRVRSEEHTSELQSLMRISYAVFCLKKKNKLHKH